MNIEQEGLVLLKYFVGKLEELELVRGKVAKESIPFFFRDEEYAQLQLKKLQVATLQWQNIRPNKNADGLKLRLFEIPMEQAGLEPDFHLREGSYLKRLQNNDYPYREYLFRSPIENEKAKNEIDKLICRIQEQLKK